MTLPKRELPRWGLTFLLAGLSSLGPFSIDTYFPAFSAIASGLNASYIQVQQTLSIYLFGFSLMLLFHGSLSDAFGRRPAILVSLAIFFLASVGCALAPTIHALIVFRLIQGLSAGAGIVVGRAIIRDLYDPVEAQKMLSQVTMIFGLAPAIAPIIGGWLYIAFGWQSIFIFIAIVGALLLFTSYFYLPESLPENARHSFRFAPLSRSYRMVFFSRRFVLLSLAVSCNFAAFFLYIAAAPAFIEHILKLGPTEYAWLFLPGVIGIIAGAYISGGFAGRITLQRGVTYGYVIMAIAALANVVYNYFASLTLPWAVLPIMVYTVGMSITMPAIGLLVIDLFPTARGMAASLQAFVTTLMNSILSGALAPVLAESNKTLALGLLCIFCGGVISWVCYLSLIKSLPNE